MANRPVDELITRLRLEDEQFKSKVTESASLLSKLQDKFRKPTDLNVGNSVKNLKQIQNGMETIDVSKLNQAIDTVNRRFSLFGEVGTAAVHRVTNSVIDMGRKMASALTTDGIRTGFQEYELKLGSIQTILANTARHGTTLEDVNKALDELNVYADKTIYNFADMTRNIGLFTNAGITVQDATSMIKGFSNEAAASGTNTAQAAGAAYQLSQALSAGVIRLMDWRSLTNASMGNKNMQNGLLEIAQAMGTIASTGTDASEVQRNFNSTLEKGWLTTDVMSTYLRIMAGDMDEAAMASIGLSQSQVEQFTKQQQMAEDAATKVRSWTQLIDTVQEAIGSGWARSWEIMAGDFNEATDLFTAINDVVSPMIDGISDARNAFLELFVDLGGRQYLIEGFANAFRVLSEVLAPVGDAIRTVFPTLADFFGGTLADQLGRDSEGGLAAVADGMGATKEELSEIQRLADEVIEGIYGNGEARVQALEALGHSYERVQDRVNQMLLPDYVSKFADELGTASMPGGLMGTAGQIAKSINDIASSSESGVQSIVKLAKGFADFFKNLRISEDTANKLRTIFTGLFSVIDTGLSLVSKVGSVIGSVIGAIAPHVGGFLLDILAQVAEVLIWINDFVTSNTLGQIFTKMFDGITNALGISASTVNTIKGWFTEIGTVVTNFWDILTGNTRRAGSGSGIDAALGAGAAAGRTRGLLDILYGAAERIRESFEWMRDGGIITTFSNALNTLGRTIGWVADKARAAWAPIRNFFEPFVNAARSGISKAFDGIKDWFGSIGDWASTAWPAIQRLWDMLKGKFSSAGEGTGSIFSQIAGHLSNLGQAFQEYFGTGYSNIKRNLESFWSWIKEFFTSPDIAIDTFTRNLSNALDNIGAFLGDMGQMIADVVGYFGQVSPAAYLNVAAIFGVLLIFKQAIKLINAIKAPKTSLSEIGKSLKGMFDNIGKAFKDFGTAAQTMRWVSIALAVGVLIKSIKTIADLAMENPVGLVAGVATVGAVLFALTKSLQLIGNNSISTGTALTISAIGFAVKTIARVIGDIAALRGEDLVKGTVVVGLIIGFLGVAVGAMNYLSNLNPGKGSGIGGALSVIALAVAVKMIVGAIADIGAMDRNVLMNGEANVAIILMALSALTSVVNVSSKFSSFGKGLGSMAVILSLVAGVKLLGDAAIKLGSMDKGLVRRGIDAISELMVMLGVMTGMLTVISSVTSFGNQLGSSAVIWTLVDGTLRLADKVIELASYPSAQIQSAADVIEQLERTTGIWAALITASSKLTSAGQALGSASIIWAISESTVALADTVIKLAGYDKVDLVKGGATVVALELVTGTMTILITKLGDLNDLGQGLGYSAITGSITLATVALADMLIKLSGYADSELLRGGLAVGGLLLSIGAVTTLITRFGGLKTALEGIGYSIVMGTVVDGVLELAGMIAELGQIPTDQLLKGLGAIGALSLFSGALTTVFSRFGQWREMLAGGASVGGIGFGLGQLAEGIVALQDVDFEGIATGLGVFTIAVGGMIAAAVLVKTLGVTVELTALGIALAGLGIAVGGIGIGLDKGMDALAKLGDMLGPWVETVKGWVQPLIDIFQGLGDAISGAFDKLDDALGGGYVDISKVFTSDQSVQGAVNAAGVLNDAFRQAISDAQGVPARNYTGDEILGFMGFSAPEIFAAFEEGMSFDQFNTAVIDQVAEDIWSYFGDAISQTTGLTYEEMQPEIQKAAEEVIKGYYDALTTEANKEPTGVGEGLSASISQTLTKVGATAVAQARQIGKDIRDAIGGAGVSSPAIRQPAAPKGTSGKVRPSAPTDTTAPTQALVAAPAVNMTPVITQMSNNAAEVGQAYTSGISKYIPIATAAGTSIGMGSVTGTGITGILHTLSGQKTGQNYVQGVTDSQGASYTAGLGLGTRSNAGTLFTVMLSLGSGIAFGANYVSGVLSKHSAAYSAGAGLASAAVSGMRGNAGTSAGFSVGSMLGQGLVDGINSRASAARAAGASLAIAANTGIRQGGVIKSPSRLTYATAGMLVEGLVNGIVDRTSKVVTATRDMVRSAIDMANDMTSTFMSALYEDEVYTPTIRPVLDMSEAENMAGLKYQVHAGLGIAGMDAQSLDKLSNIESDNRSIRLAQGMEHSFRNNQNGTTNDNSNHVTINNEGLLNGAIFNVRDEMDIKQIVTEVDKRIGESMQRAMGGRTIGS